MSFTKRLLGRLTGLGSVPRLPVAEGSTTGSVPGAGELIRLLIVGESTAAGVGAPTLDEALPGCLTRSVAGLTGCPVDWTVIAQDGLTVRAARLSLLPRIAGSAADPDVVVLALGVNDLIRLRSGRSWRSDMRALVTALREVMPDARVLIAGIPPAYLSPALPAPLRWLARRRAHVLDRQSVRLAQETGVSVETVSHIAPLVTPEFFAEDRFHPSPHGYRIWSRYLAVGVAGVIS